MCQFYSFKILQKFICNFFYFLDITSLECLTCSGSLECYNSSVTTVCFFPGQTCYVVEEQQNSIRNKVSADSLLIIPTTDDLLLPPRTVVNRGCSVWFDDHCKTKMKLKPDIESCKVKLFYLNTECFYNYVN